MAKQLSEQGEARKAAIAEILDNAVKALDRGDYAASRDYARTASDAIQIDLVQQESPLWEDVDPEIWGAETPTE